MRCRPPTSRCPLKAIKKTVDNVQERVGALSMAGAGGGAGLQVCPASLELDPAKTPWSTVFPLFGRLRRDASVEHMAGVSYRYFARTTWSIGVRLMFSVPTSFVPKSYSRSFGYRMWYMSAAYYRVGYVTCNMPLLHDIGIVAAAFFFRGRAATR